jgi:bifunctional non-homologous end joining protein LigD
MHKTIHPMLAGSLPPEKLKELWNNPDWICEEKIDGSRYVLQYDSHGIPLLTSRKRSVKTNEMVDKTQNLMGYVCEKNVKFKNTIIDGEIQGGNSFGDTVSLMGSTPERAQQMLKDGFKVKYIVYDILEYQGTDLRNRPFNIRRLKLQNFLLNYHNPYIELIRVLPNEPSSFDQIVSEGGEGVILKHKMSQYQEDKRGKDWIKVKKTDTFDGIIIGMTEGTGKYKKSMGALRIGQYVGDEIVEVATISGMTDDQRDYFSQNIQKLNGQVIEFEAQEKTKKRYRHPRFVRLRNDKSPTECKF